MAINTSALMTVLLAEPDSVGIAAAIETGSSRLISAATLLEASMVIKARTGEAGGRELDLPPYRGGIQVMAVDQDQAEAARVAWRRFGNGRHPAALNHGDCFVYALAKLRRLPLLFRGNDFAPTGIEQVVIP